MTASACESVVFVDDDDEVRRANAQSLELAGFEVRAFASAEAAQAALGPQFPGVVVTDVRLPGMNGLGLLRRLIELDPDLPVILITGHGDIPMAVEAMREGAYDFFEKPYPPDRLIDSVRRAAEKRRLVLENRTLRAELAHHQADDPLLLGRSPAMEKLRQTLAGLAEIDVDVLMVGETGSGKEAAAMAVHRWSRREQGRFVALNCSALPEATAEGELCGHEGGAFAGGARRRVGRVEQADRGTLFLAEVESLPLDPPSEAHGRAAAADGGAVGGGRGQAGRRPRRGGDRHRPRRGPGPAGVPRGPLLPPERGHGAHPAAPRPARGHTAPVRALRLPGREAVRPRGPGADAGDHALPPGAPVAGEHPRTGPLRRAARAGAGRRGG